MTACQLPGPPYLGEAGLWVPMLKEAPPPPCEGPIHDPSPLSLLGCQKCFSAFQPLNYSSGISVTSIGEVVAKPRRKRERRRKEGEEEEAGQEEEARRGEERGRKGRKRRRKEEKKKGESRRCLRQVSIFEGVSANGKK